MREACISHSDRRGQAHSVSQSAVCATCAHSHSRLAALLELVRTHVHACIRSASKLGPLRSRAHPLSSAVVLGLQSAGLQRRRALVVAALLLPDAAALSPGRHHRRPCAPPRAASSHRRDRPTPSADLGGLDKQPCHRGRAAGSRGWTGGRARPRALGRRNWKAFDKYAFHCLLHRQHCLCRDLLGRFRRSLLGCVCCSPVLCGSKAG